MDLANYIWQGLKESAGQTPHRTILPRETIKDPAIAKLLADTMPVEGYPGYYRSKDGNTLYYYDPRKSELPKQIIPDPLKHDAKIIFDESKKDDFIWPTKQSPNRARIITSEGLK